MSTVKKSTRVFYLSDLARIEREVRGVGTLWVIAAVLVITLAFGLVGAMDYEAEKAERVCEAPSCNYGF